MLLLLERSFHTTFPIPHSPPAHRLPPPTTPTSINKCRQSPSYPTPRSPHPPTPQPTSPPPPFRYYTPAPIPSHLVDAKQWDPLLAASDYGTGMAGPIPGVHSAGLSPSAYHWLNTDAREALRTWHKGVGPKPARGELWGPDGSLWALPDGVGGMRGGMKAGIEGGEGEEAVGGRGSGGGGAGGGVEGYGVGEGEGGVGEVVGAAEGV